MFYGLGLEFGVEGFGLWIGFVLTVIITIKGVYARRSISVMARIRVRVVFELEFGLYHSNFLSEKMPWLQENANSAA